VVFGGEEFGQAQKSRILTGASLGDEKCWRADIRWNDAFLWAGVRGRRRAGGRCRSSRNRKGTRGIICRELPFEQFHGDEGPAIVFFDGVNECKYRVD